jgi:hypothetical protein
LPELVELFLNPLTIGSLLAKSLKPVNTSSSWPPMDGLGLPSLLTVELLEMAVEKKLFNAGFRLPESMLLRIKGLAEAKGMTERTCK